MILNLSSILAFLPAVITACPTPFSRGNDLIAALEKRQGLQSVAGNFSTGAKIYTPDWPEFANETGRWSTYDAPTFDLLFIPETEDDIAVALRYLTSHNVPFLTQGGGHGYSPTLSVIQNAVQINMENFNQISMNPDNTISIGGAAHFGDVYAVAYAAGRELTLGSCPCVGITGATLGGGHGRLQGKHGLSADALIAMRIVLGNGTIVEASESSNPDLFWGMRGAGQNFGAVVESTYQTYPAANNGRHYNADMVFSDDSLEGVLETINHLIPGLDPALAMDLILFTDPSSMAHLVYLNLVYAGPQEQGEVYANYFATTGNRTHKRLTINRLANNATELTFAELPYQSAGGAIAAACARGYRQNTYSLSTLDFDIENTRALWESYKAFTDANTGAAGSLLLFEVFGQQAIVSANAAATAVGDRDKANVLALFEMIYSQEDDNVAGAADQWARGWRDTFSDPDLSGYDRLYVYQNYAHGDEPLQALYGYEPWRMKKLQKLKRTYDPTDSFSGYHAIPLR